MDTFANRLTISIASKDRPEVVYETLRKIHAFGLGDCPLILCDDGSSPSLDPSALALFPRGRLIRNDVAQGQAGARNRIARECRTPFLLQLDDDSYPVEGDLAAALEALSSDPECFAVALALIEPTRQRASRRGASEKILPVVRSFIGCACLLRIKEFLEMDGYAAWIGATGEEDELCLRAWKYGRIVRFSDHLVIQHDCTSVARNTSGILYRSFRHWSWIWRTHAPTSCLLPILAALWSRALWQLLTSGTSVALRGCMDGLHSPAAGFPPSERMKLGDYLRHRGHPHHLDWFERCSDSHDFVAEIPKPTDRPRESGESPLVSVIVPVFNRVSRIVECIASVRAQSYRPLELIVVDDGSTDDTPGVLSRLREEIGCGNGLVFKVITQDNAGAPAARNHGFRESAGDWILFLDSDDLLLPDKVKQAMQEARKFKADIVYSKAQYIDQAGTCLQRFWGRPLSGDWNDHFEFSWQTMCAVYSRHAIERIGPWNERLIISQDWEYCIRAVSSGLAIHYEDRVDALYRCEGDDRIGSGISTRKHQGREMALWAVFDHLRGSGLMCATLKKRFRSRLLHVLLSYRAVGESALARDLAKKMQDREVLDGITTRVLRYLPSRRQALFIIERFHRRVNSRRLRAGISPSCALGHGKTKRNSTAPHKKGLQRYGSSR